MYIFKIISTIPKTIFIKPKLLSSPTACNLTTTPPPLPGVRLHLYPRGHLHRPLLRRGHAPPLLHAPHLPPLLHVHRVHLGAVAGHLLPAAVRLELHEIPDPQNDVHRALVEHRAVRPVLYVLYDRFQLRAAVDSHAVDLCEDFQSRAREYYPGSAEQRHPEVVVRQRHLPRTRL